jgi:putative two-component system response regulator
MPKQDQLEAKIEAVKHTFTLEAFPPPSSLMLDPSVREGERQQTVLIVDELDINRRLLRAMMKATPYRVLEAKRASEALQILENEAVDLIILDLMMPEVSGPEFCQRVKMNRRTQLVPVLMITSVQGVENEIAGIASGADEFLTRPLHPESVRTRIRNMLRNKAAIDSLEEAETILFALAQAVEKRDKHTSDHCDRLARYSVGLGIALGLPRTDLLALHRGGYLHDIGKVCVPDAILFKQGKLEADEWVIMKSHTTKGEEICRPMKTLASVLPIIRNHHERWDGSGYPDGMKGEEIPLLARILQIADIYDALTTSRPYKVAFPHKEAMQIMEDEVKKGWRDADLVSLFHECCDKIQLNNTPSSANVGSFQQSLENMNTHVQK